MLAGLLGLVILVVKLFPDTALARVLHLWLVERPLAMAERIERRHLILLVILLCAGQTLALVGSVELAMAYAVDMSLYLDAMLATYVAAAATRFRTMAAAFRATLRRAAGAVRRPRARSRRTGSAAARSARAENDDEPGWRPALRAA